MCNSYQANNVWPLPHLKMFFAFFLQCRENQFKFVGCANEKQKDIKRNFQDKEMQSKIEMKNRKVYLKMRYRKKNKIFLSF